MTHQFQSEAIRGGNIIRPQFITIDNNSITISQRSKFLISNNTQHIKINNITNIQIDKNPLFSKITIETNSGSTIIIDNLNNKDARQIVNLIS